MALFLFQVDLLIRFDEKDRQADPYFLPGPVHSDVPGGGIHFTNAAHAEVF